MYGEETGGVLASARVGGASARRQLVEGVAGPQRCPVNRGLIPASCIYLLVLARQSQRGVPQGWLGWAAGRWRVWKG